MIILECILQLIEERRSTHTERQFVSSLNKRIKSYSGLVSKASIQKTRSELAQALIDAKSSNSPIHKEVGPLANRLLDELHQTSYKFQTNKTAPNTVTLDNYKHINNTSNVHWLHGKPKK